MSKIINGTKEIEKYNRKWFILEEELNEARYIYENKQKFIKDYREYIDRFNGQEYCDDIENYKCERCTGIKVISKF